jgi:hypothetical protein
MPGDSGSSLNERPVGLMAGDEGGVILIMVIILKITAVHETHEKHEINLKSFSL